VKKLKSVLLIDDNEIINLFNKNLLYSMDLAEHVHICANGREALSFLKTIDKSTSNNEYSLFPELIILDLNMPFMDGFGFLQEYQDYFGYTKPEVIIWLLTSSINDMDLTRAESYIILNDFVSKPMDPLRFKELLSKHFYKELAE